MKYAALILLLLTACNAGPLATDAELAYGLGVNSHDDQTFAASEDARLAAAVPVANWTPGLAVDAPPPVPDAGTVDWGELVPLLGGTMGAAVAAALALVRALRGPGDKETKLARNAAKKRGGTA